MLCVLHPAHVISLGGFDGCGMLDMLCAEMFLCQYSIQALHAGPERVLALFPVAATTSAILVAAPNERWVEMRHPRFDMR